MNKLVYSVFKAIALSIIFVFIFDMAFYLYRAVSLNARMESISTSLKKVVMDNNYLPSEDAKLYANILGQMVADFNGCTYTIGADGKLTFTDTDSSDNFISGMHWNFGSDAVGVGSSQLMSLTSSVYSFNGTNWSSANRNVVEKDMSKPREYGDIQIVQLRVGVYQPLWNWSSSPTTVTPNYQYSGEANEINGPEGFNRAAITTRGTEFTYTYYVPCMKYKSTNAY